MEACWYNASLVPRPPTAKQVGFGYEIIIVATRVKFLYFSFVCLLCNYSKILLSVQLAILLFSCDMRIFLLVVALRNRLLLIT